MREPEVGRVHKSQHLAGQTWIGLDGFGEFRRTVVGILGQLEQLDWPLCGAAGVVRPPTGLSDFQDFLGIRHSPILKRDRLPASKRLVAHNDSSKT